MRLNDVRTATLIGDLNELYMTIDCSLTDLVCCTKLSMTTYVRLLRPIGTYPSCAWLLHHLEKLCEWQLLIGSQYRHLWREAATVVHMLLDMARPVVSEVVENRRFQGKLDRPLPASRYLDTTNVTFEILFECADKSVDRVERKISVLEDEFGELFVNSSEKPSSRPLGEIVMEAVLYTTTPATPSYPLVKKSLGKSNYTIEDILTPGMFSVLLTSYQSRFPYVSELRAFEQPAQLRHFKTYGRPQFANLQSRGSDNPVWQRCLPRSWR